MKRILQSKNFIQKMAIVILVVLLCYCIIPTYTYATFGGEILKVFLQLLAALGDVVIGTLNHYMLGTDYLINSVMLDRTTQNITNPQGSLYADGSEQVNLTLNQEHDSAGNVDDDNEELLYGGLWGDDDEWQVPNILYSPEAIFTNSVAILDVNFLNPNKYQAVQEVMYDAEGNPIVGARADKASESAASYIQETISEWYIGFRNIAVVALLIVLVYIGIKILIGSVSEKAKYKESLRDWFVALCLVFIIHFIMSGILMLSQKATEIFKESADGIVVEVINIKGGGDTSVKFKTSLAGVARLRVQSQNAGTAMAYCFIYIALVLYTILFTFIYFKRFLYMAFLTMIAPLVAITYPIDRMGDGHAQAFNMWFREYTMNAMLQPLHLILYTALVSTANDLVVKNPIYALVAIGFLIPAEKFVKSMFGLNKAETPGTMGSFAVGALAMNALGKAKNLPGGDKGNSGKGDKIRTADNGSGDDQYLSNSPRYSGLGSGAGTGAESSDGDNSGTGNSDGYRFKSIARL